MWGIERHIAKLEYFLRVLGLKRTLFLILRKAYSIVYRKVYFPKASSLMFMGHPVIIGRNFIEIDSMTVGKELRLEVLNFTQAVKPKLTIGSGVSFGNYVHIACVNSISIGDHVLAGSNVYITDHDHGEYSEMASSHSSPTERPAARKLSSQPVHIGNNVYIGEYVSILKGVRIGNGSVIGAGSVVTKDVEDNTIVAGVPAKPIKRFDSKANVWTSL